MESITRFITQKLKLKVNETCVRVRTQRFQLVTPQSCAWSPDRR